LLYFDGLADESKPAPVLENGCGAVSRLFYWRSCEAKRNLKRSIFMKYEKSEKFDPDFLKENMMGPNCVKLLEDISSHMALRPGMRVLDLGCGKGLTSIFLAREFGVTVYATDLWIPATENFLRFKALELEDQIIPIHADAHELPYAEGYFDAAVCIDAYLYFGMEEGYMDRCLAPLVKPGGGIAIGIPGVKADLDGVPAELAPFISAEDFAAFRSTGWWKKRLEASHLFTLERIWEFEGYDEAWNDWLQSDNPYAVSDRDMIRSEEGKYMNLISILGKRA
jgi:cyclopropane fatty-acyl-phospholipid synthase-like methyltransferase